jgi:GDP-D-mannose dehydratase
MDATRRGNTFVNLKVHRLKYKGMARIKRKETRRLAMGGVKSPKDTGEEMPPFFLPQRYKLMFRVL